MCPRCGTEDTSEDGGRQRVVPSYGTGWTRPPIPGTYVPGFHMAPLRPSGLLMEYPGNRARARPKSSGPACLLRDVKIADQCLVRDVKIPALFLQRTENKDGAPAKSLAQDENGQTKTKINRDGQECPSYPFAYTKTSPGRAVRVRLARVF